MCMFFSGKHHLWEDLAFRLTLRPSTVTLAAHARRGLIILCDIAVCVSCFFCLWPDA